MRLDPNTMGGGGITRKRLVVTLLCVSSAKAHITLISFPLFTHKTQSQVFRASSILVGEKSPGAKDHSFFFFCLFFKCFFFFFKKPSASSKVTHTSIYRLQYPWQVDTLIHRSIISPRLDIKGWRQWNLPPSQTEKKKKCMTLSKRS